MARRKRLNRGDSGIWLAGSALGTCLLMIGAMIGLILSNGLGFFWPGDLVQLTLHDGTVLLGEVVGAGTNPEARYGGTSPRLESPAEAR